MVDRLEITKSIELAAAKTNGEQELCRFVLLAGKVARDSRQDAAIAFDWAKNREVDDPTRMKDAIAKIEALDENEFFKAAILLLWIEACRLEHAENSSHCKKNAMLVIAAMDRRIPIDSRMVNWLDFFHLNFVKYWGENIAEILTTEALINVLSRGEGLQVISLLLYLLESKKNPSEEEVDLVFRRAIAIASRITRESEKAQSVSLLIEKLMNMRRFQQAQQMAEQIQGKLSREKTLYAIAEGMAQAGDFKRAIAIMNNADINNAKTTALSSIVGLAFASLTIQESKEMAYRIVPGRNKDSALIVVARGLAGGGEIQEALNVAKDIEDKARRSYVLLYAVQKSLDKDVSWKLLQKIANSIPIASCKAEALAIVAESMAKANCWQQAMDIAYKIGDLRHRDNALAKIARYHLDKAMFAQALQVINDLKSDAIKYQAISQTVKVLAKEKITHQGSVLFRQIVEIAGHINDRRLKSRALSVILEIFPQAGTYSGATRRIEETGEKIRLLLLMAQASVKEKRFSRADIKFEKAILSVKLQKNDALHDLAEIGKALSQSERQAGRPLFAKAKLQLQHAFEKKIVDACALNDSEKKAYSLLEISQALSCAELNDEAQCNLDKAIASAHRIEQEQKKWDSLRMAICELIEVGQHEQAQNEVDLVLEEFRNIPSPEHRYAILLQVAHTLACWHKRPQAWQVLKESIDAALEIERVEYRFVETDTCKYYEPVNLSSKLLSEMIWRIGRSGLFGLAIESVDYIVENIEEYWDRSRAMSDIASMMIEANEFSKAAAFAHKNKSSLSGVNIIDQVLEGLIDTGRFQEALDLANSYITKNGLKYKALVEIGKAVNRKKNNHGEGIFEQAISVARRLDNRIQGGQEKAAALLCIVREAVNMERRGSIFIQAIDATHSISSPKIKYQVLANMANAMERAGNEKAAAFAWQKAAVPAPEIENMEARYSAIVAILQALSKDEVKTGKRLLKHALNATGCLKNIKNRNLSLSLLAAIAAKYQDMSTAWEILQKNIFSAHSVELDWHHYMAVLEISGLLAELGEVSQAMNIASKVPAGSYADQILTSMARGFIHADLFDRALETLQRMNVWSLVRALPSIFEMLVAKGERGTASVQKIIDYLDRQDKLYAWGDEFWPDLAKIQASGGLFEEAIDSAVRISKVQIKYEVLLSIIRTSAKKKIETALLSRLVEIATEIGMPSWHENDLYYKTKILVAVANTHTSSGDEQALQILKHALKVANSISENSIKYVGARSEKSLAILEVARAFVQAGRPGQALKLVCEIENDALRGTYERCEALMTISEDLTRKKNFNYALEAAGKLGKEWKQKKAYLQIVEALAREKKIEKALEVASMIAQGSSACTALAVIAENVRCQDSERAEAIFRQALKMASHIQDNVKRACSVYEIIQSMAKGSPDWALEVANNIDLARYRSKALLKLALSAMGRQDECKASALFAKTIESACLLVDTDKKKFLPRLVQALLKAKFFDQALAMAKKIKNIYQRSELFSLAARGYLKNGDWQHALDTASFIENDFDCYKTMEIIADYLSELNNSQRSELLDKSLIIARNMGKYQRQLLLAIARALLRAEKREQASIVLQMRALSDYSLCNTFSATMANGDCPKLLQEALATMALSSLEREKILKSFQQDVVKYFPAPLSLLKRTFALLPFSPSLACHSVRMLQLAHLKARNRGIYRQLIEIFPLAFAIDD